MSKDLVADALNDYNRAQSSNSGTSGSNNNNKNRYLITSLPKEAPIGEEMVKTIRVIPMMIDGEQKMFGTAFFHSMQVDGNYRKIYDPFKNDNGEENPILDAAKAIFTTAEAEQSEDKKKQLKQMGGKYLSDLYYIFKVLERGKEHEGCKYWRFKKNSKGDGVMDKIIPIMQGLKDAGKPNIHDFREGRDLTITFKKVQSGNGLKYTKVTSVQKEDPSATTTDQNVIKMLKEDTSNWKDVYKKYPKEYLALVAEGKTPIWNKDLNRYVAKTESSSNQNPSNIDVRSANEEAGVSKPDNVTPPPSQAVTMESNVTSQAPVETLATTEPASDESGQYISDEDLPF